MNNQVSTYTPTQRPSAPSAIQTTEGISQRSQSFAEKLLKLLTLLLLFVGLTDALHANDIRITNSILVPGDNSTPDRIQFDIAWENSWRHPFSTGINNWDAAWVFIKYREVGDTGSAWKHLYLSNTPADYETGSWTGEGPGGAVIDPGLVNPRNNHSAAFRGNPNSSTSHRNPVVGALVYRENVGRGLFKATEMAFPFSMSENDMSTDKLYDFKVFAIEMVYVPQGAFFAGNVGTEFGRFIRGTTTNEPEPFRVSKSWATDSSGPCVRDLADCLWGTSTLLSSTIGDPGTLDEDHPTGYHAFYMMKYPISQQQYVDFLNTLTYTQQFNRINGSPDDEAGTFAHGANRHAIKIKTPGVNDTTPAVYETDNPFVANNYMRWTDGAAYMDWAGLRPMSELEYEKAARGPLDPVPNEFAWGTSNLVQATGFENEGDPDEVPTPSSANGNLPPSTSAPLLGGPVRVGSFATSATNRVESGASYWGIMELSGNLEDLAVSVGGTAGRNFTGLHGNGLLNDNGNANMRGWPYSTQVFQFLNVTGATGTGNRGGAWNDRSFGKSRVSSRASARDQSNSRASNKGFRGVRTAGCFNDASAPGFDTTGGLSPDAVSEGQLATYKVNGTGDYLWVVPNDWDIITGQGTNEILVVVGATLPGTVRVAEYDTCGAGEEVTRTVTEEQ